MAAAAAQGANSSYDENFSWFESFPQHLWPFPAATEMLYHEKQLNFLTGYPLEEIPEYESRDEDHLHTAAAKDMYATATWNFLPQISGLTSMQPLEALQSTEQHHDHLHRGTGCKSAAKLHNVSIPVHEVKARSKRAYETPVHLRKISPTLCEDPVWMLERLSSRAHNISSRVAAPSLLGTIVQQIGVSRLVLFGLGTTFQTQYRTPLQSNELRPTMSQPTLL
jgi:hypothetical protein